MIRLLLNQTKTITSSVTVRNLPQIVKSLKSCTLVKKFSSAALPAESVHGNVGKDILVYKYDNPKFFKMISIFSISQFLFWGYLGHWSFTSLRNTKVPDELLNDENASWFRRVNLGEDKYKYGMAVTCIAIAYVVLLVSWTFILRSVRYLVYSKNGKDISFVTYTPFGKNRIMTVPIKNISAEESRLTARTFLPIKVQGRKLFYVLDMKGEFKNKILYDRQIGLRRKLV